MFLNLNSTSLHESERVTFFAFVELKPVTRPVFRFYSSMAFSKMTVFMPIRKNNFLWRNYRARQFIALPPFERTRVRK